MPSLADSRLYGILDLSYAPSDRAAAVATQMLRGGIDILQLRAKDASDADVLDVSREVQPLCAQAGVPFILNDRPHLVREARADGAHVGQDDLSIAEARALAGPGAIIGKSTHSLDQARAAAAESADYIGFGPLFATPTKPDYTPIGTDDIRRVHELVSVPIFCIGGIKLENLASVLAAGAQRVVIVSGILQAPDIASYVRTAKEMITPIVCVSRPG